MPDMGANTPTIPEWYRGREVLVTGGTGFMGKVLLAKLLMSCPDVKIIYVLIREKKGVNPQNRLQALIQEEPFRKLRENYRERLKKLVVLPGDTTAEGLGIAPADAELLKNNVSVVINMAANVRFDLTLKMAINLNTKSTHNTVKFVKEFKKLESFIHVSTAYCHCQEPIIEEKSYPVTISPEEVMKLADTVDSKDLEEMRPQLIGDLPNTYSFTKALSEDIVQRCGLPAGVARPSIVIGSYKEPVRGWVDNTNGPTGLMIGAGKGVIRSMLCDPDFLVDVIPCDMAVNATIGLSWKVGLEKPKSPLFMNITESNENPLSWRYALETGKKHALANPFPGPLWYPGGDITSSKIIHWISVFFLHTIPAYFIDALMILTGNKPFLVKVQERVTNGINLVYYYTTKEWNFRNERLKELRNCLTPSDKEEFFMDIGVISWDEYLLNYILSIRQFVLKEDPSTLPRTRRVFAWLYVGDIIFRIGFLVLFAWLVYSWMLLPFGKMRLGTTIDSSHLI